MKTRLSHILKAIDELPAGEPIDANVIAKRLDLTTSSVRRDLRDLKDAGALTRPVLDPMVPSRKKPECAVYLADKKAVESAKTEIATLDKAISKVEASVNVTIDSSGNPHTVYHLRQTLPLLSPAEALAAAASSMQAMGYKITSKDERGFTAEAAQSDLRVREGLREILNEAESKDQFLRIVKQWTPKTVASRIVKDKEKSK